MDRQNINNLTPAKAIHPGSILKKELSSRGVKQRDFAGEIGIAPTQLNEILNGKRGVSAELSLLLEASLDIEAIVWLNLQSRFEINTARKNKKTNQKTAVIKDWKIIKDLIPYSFFKKEKIIQGDHVKDLKTIYNIYDVNTISELESQVELAQSSRFRKSSKRQVNGVNLTGWVTYVKYKASHRKAKRFSFDKKDQLVKELRQTLFEENLLSKVDKLLAKYGIIFIHQKKLDKVPVDGMAFWSKNNPAIAVSLRYKRLDNLAFTLFHEIGHIFLHLESEKTKPFIDDIEAIGSHQEKEEIEANTFAENHLIPEIEWNSFMTETYEFTSENIMEFSDQIGIHPAVTLGRLKKEHNEYYRKRFAIPNEIS